MEWLTSLLGGAASAATGGLFGAAVRLLPAAGAGIARIFTAAADRKHELAMRELDWKIAQQQGEQKIRELDAAGGWETAGKTLDAMREALRGQEAPSGVAWADAMSKAVRPITTFYFLAMYGLVKVAMFTLAMMDETVTTSAALPILWGAADSQMFFGILGFWFVDRQLGKGAMR